MVFASDYVFRSACSYLVIAVTGFKKQGVVPKQGKLLQT